MIESFMASVKHQKSAVKFFNAISVFPVRHSSAATADAFPISALL
jgi:hypothetical protein